MPVNPTLSSDGSRVAYTIGETTGMGRGYVLSTAGGTPQQVCQQCVLYRFISDNRRVPRASRPVCVHMRLYDVNRSSEDLVTSPEGVLNRPHVSAGDKWLAFQHPVNAVSRICVVPFIPGHPPSRQPVDDPSMSPRQPVDPPAGRSTDPLCISCSMPMGSGVSGGSASIRHPVVLSAGPSPSVTFTAVEWPQPAA